MAFALWKPGRERPDQPIRQQSRGLSATRGLLDFGPVNLQLYATTDVTRASSNGHPENLWTRHLSDLWNPTRYADPVTGNDGERCGVLTRWVLTRFAGEM